MVTSFRLTDGAWIDPARTALTAPSLPLFIFDLVRRARDAARSNLGFCAALVFREALCVDELRAEAPLNRNGVATNSQEN